MKTIRFLSNAAQIGHTRTESDNGKWTVWEVCVQESAKPTIFCQWEIVSTPIPLIYNFSVNDYNEYTGRLYREDELYCHRLREAALVECADCGKEICIYKEDYGKEHKSLCYDCRNERFNKKEWSKNNEKDN